MTTPTLVYLSIGFLDAEQPPWVPALRELDPDTFWIDNLTSLHQTLERFGPRFLAALAGGERALSFRTARRLRETLLLPGVFEPATEKSSVLAAVLRSESMPTNQAVDRALYLLVRSRVVVVDLDRPGYGERGGETLYAAQIGLPVIGVTSRFVVDPWLASRCRLVLTNAGPLDILNATRWLTQEETAANGEDERNGRPGSDLSKSRRGGQPVGVPGSSGAGARGSAESKSPEAAEHQAAEA